MDYYVSRGEIAVVCYCMLEKKTTGDYVSAQKECEGLKGDCSKRILEK